MPNDRDLNYRTETAIRGKFLGHGAVVRSALGGNYAADLRCTIIPMCSSHHSAFDRKLSAVIEHDSRMRLKSLQNPLVWPIP